MKEVKVDRMKTLLETLEHVNVTFSALEHNPIFLRFTNKFLAKQHELREIEEARKISRSQTVHNELVFWTMRFQKSKGVKGQINLGRKESRKEILSNEPSLAKEFS